MAIIKKSELKNLKKDDVEKKLEELKMELLRINAKKSMGGGADNPGKIRLLRRTIAKLKTVSNAYKFKNTQEVREKQ